MNGTHKRLTAALLAVAASHGWAADALDEISLEDLAKTEITSVSRKSQSLANVPAAAFVISSDDIRRSGAQALPDVLRMVPGIEVAQIANGRYAVAARGFNGRFANKLQVLIDGRSIYNPMFSGVMWEDDPIALDDIERIEVIRGPGAAMWGVNAVSGVINIISKHSRSQAGGLVAPTIGTQGMGGLYARHGGSLDDDTTWKLSFQGRHAEPSKKSASGDQGHDRLSNALLDARFDRNLGVGRDLALWAKASRSSVGDLAMLDVAPTLPVAIRPRQFTQVDAGQSVAGRYRWLTGSGIESSVQMSLESSSIEISDYIEQDRTTVDLDYQGRYTVSAHDLLWGLSHRSSSDTANTSAIVLSLAHPKYTQRTTGVFVHDDWTLIPERLRLGAGARWDYTNLGGYTFAPNTTLMWTPSHEDTVWLKYAKAPRMPARAEQDANVLIGFQPARPPIPLPVVIRNTPGDEALKAETMRSVELGYRTQLSANFNANVTGYRQRYTDRVSGRLGSVDMATLFPLAIIQDVNPCNCSGGWITGAELAADWLILPIWRLQLSYSWTRIAMENSGNPAAQASIKDSEQGTPRHYGSLRSQWNLSPSQQFDAWIRGSAGYYRTDAPYFDLARVPGYVTLDLRYAHKLSKSLELAATGRNLIGGRRTEFISDYIPSVALEIGPSLLLSARWTY
jgi:iron complex outermembrane recepter protein